MFTGLVAVMGTLKARQARGPGARLTVQGHLDGPFVLGESVAVDGVCLSVDAAVGGDGFEADASAETLARTTLGALPDGSPVHLERAVCAGAPLGGHLVTGHVDGVATLVERRQVGEALHLAFRIPRELERFVAQKGCIAIDGVSLTVNAVDRDRFDVMIIPHTLAKTKLGKLVAGHLVNVEVDLVARYVARLLSTT
jgi:riboflavin synthase